MNDQNDAAQEAAEESPCEIERIKARREEVEALAKMEGMDLDNDEIMSKAWR